MKKQIVIILGIFLSTLFVNAQTTLPDSQNVSVVTEQPTTVADSVAPSVIDPSATIDSLTQKLKSFEQNLLDSKENKPILWFAIGFLFFAFHSFRKMALRNPGTKFSLIVWAEGNWLKAALFIGFVAYTYFTVPDISNLEAFAIGFAPAKGIDWLKKELNKIADLNIA